jgi:DegV family protein with EDD domain
MKNVVVVTDSTATVPTDLIQQLNIRIVPIPIIYDRQTFWDGVDVTASEVYHWLRTSESIPTTAAPSVGDFLRVYAAAGEEASGVISIHMSPRLSSTYNVALTASQLVDGVPIHVLNCRTAAMGQGFVVLEAARAAAAGAPLETVVSRAETVVSKIDLLFTLETFEYLHRGGRVGGAVALVATLLEIRPVLCLTDGHIEVLVKTRTKRKALQSILERMAAKVNGRPLHAAIFHADAPAEGEEFRQSIAERFHCVELYVTEFTPVMGAHTGPGVLGVAFYAE